MATDAWGIDDGWHDTTGAWHATPGTTHGAVRRAMGADPDAPSPPVGRDVWVLRPGAGAQLDRPRQVVLEDGTHLGDVTHVPNELPVGIHDLLPDEQDSRGVTLLVSPGRCHLPEGLRAWGLAMQVPTSPSTTSWGVGDLADVGTLARWIAERGGDVLALSPLHAATPVAPLPTSPYSPSSRRWRHPLLLRIDDIAGASSVPAVRELGQRARLLLDRSVVERDAAWSLHAEALQLLWATRSDRQRDEVARYRARHGRSLELWATFCAVAEGHGADWRLWPEALRHPDGPRVSELARSLDERVAFHAWVQLVLDEQLSAAAAGGVRLVQDLAIGVDPGGADAWALQDLLALDVSVGAPPDDFAPQGQTWGLPPFIPWRLRDAGYRPLAELLRAGMLAGGGLRVDHVMGLARLFWIPRDVDPAAGTYVRFAGRELLEVLALESTRAGALVVGEDLGTVEDSFRDELRSTAVLSTRLSWFEDQPPEQYPTQSLGMVTTHDLPTIAGLWTGADEAELEAVGRPSPPAATQRVRQRLAALTDLDADRRDPADIPRAIELVHQRLGAGASAVVLATLEDLLAVERRPNIPGTTHERPNWSLPLPAKVDELDETGVVRQVVDTLAAARGPVPRGD